MESLYIVTFIPTRALRASLSDPPISYVGREGYVRAATTSNAVAATQILGLVISVFS